MWAFIMQHTVFYGVISFRFILFYDRVMLLWGGDWVAYWIQLSSEVRRLLNV